jgi:xanthine dehydrogenase small subunit
MPFLIALGATIKLRRGAHSREMPLESFYLGYQKKTLDPGEFVEMVRIPLPRAGQLLASYKISKRIEQDISAVCSAYAFDVDEGRIVRVRIAYGGMAAVPQRATHTEAALLGGPWTHAAIQAALPALEQDYRPITDMRASSAYRMQVAKNLLERFFLEHSGAGIACRIAELEAR